jgi:hypothetical protein
MSGYVLGMSTAPDELTQWRLYADGAAGWALGYGSASLDQAFTCFTQSHSLHGAGSFRVLYDEAQLRAQMILRVQNALNVIPAMPSGPGQGRMLGTNLMFAMIYTALYFKHPAYQSEQEYCYLVAPCRERPPTPIKWMPLDVPAPLENRKSYQRPVLALSALKLAQRRWHKANSIFAQVCNVCRMLLSVKSSRERRVGSIGKQVTTREAACLAAGVSHSRDPCGWRHDLASNDT